MNNNLLRFLCCPRCKSDLKKNKDILLCSTCGSDYRITNGILKMITDVTADLGLSIKKWDEIYRKQLHFHKYNTDYEYFLNTFYKDTYDQLNAAKKIDAITYLEIGCGQFFMGQKLAKNADLVIGIDISPTALKIAKKMLDARKIKNYLLIEADILNMPIKKNSIDLIFGSGVIEHFKDTQAVVNELYRVLKKNGVSFNTVPYLNIGSLTYRQLWGNIPNLPILKQMAEFIHIKLLKSRFMKFGYEYSFTLRTMINIHKLAGFKSIFITQFNIKLMFEYIHINFIKKIMTHLAGNCRLFWPMIKIVAIK